MNASTALLYVRHYAYDYNDQRVEKGLPDPFIDSLTHDSIIVQIPLLRGQVNNRLDRVLSIFDQSKMSQESRKMLNIDDSLYGDDVEMQHILRRLLSAATNEKVRQDMNVEEEFLSAIEKRDTEILNRDYQLAKQATQIKEQSAQLEAKDAQLEAKDAQLRKSIQLLQKANLSIEEIADSLGMNVADVYGFM